MSYFLQLIVSWYLIAVILRFLFHLLRVDFRNPLAHVVVLITNPPLRYMWKFIPSVRGIDLASVLLIVFIGLLKLTLPALLAGYSLQLTQWYGALIVSFADSLSIATWALLFAVLINVVASWVAPQSHHPALRLAADLSEPLLAPLRRILPAFGGLDLSPMFILMGIRFAQQLLLSPLAQWGFSML